MSGQVIDGKGLAAQIREGLRARVRNVAARRGRPPTLAVLLVGDESVIQFKFSDLSRQQDWWILVRNDKAELCLKDPGKDVDVYFCSTLRTMHDVWMGDRTWREATAAGELVIEGERALLRNIGDWLKPSMFANSPRSPLYGA